MIRRFVPLHIGLAVKAARFGKNARIVINREYAAAGQ